MGYVAFLLGFGLMCLSPIHLAADPPPGESAVSILRSEAQDLKPLVESRLARDFLRTTSGLPNVAPRKIWLDEAKKTYLSEAEARSLSEADRRKLKLITVDESLYYNTKYGSPLAYSRPIDLLGQAGLEGVSGRKILDFGYGTVGHLRLLAGLGAEVTGVDVDPMLKALYGTPDDRGLVKNPGGRDGRIRLINGRFPADDSIRTTVGGDYDLIISKNTLKRGYVHPERPVEPRRLLNLGVDDAAFVKALHSALKPGGRVLIYNISPAPALPANRTRTGRTGIVRSRRRSGNRRGSASSPTTAMTPSRSARWPTSSDGIGANRRSTSRPTYSPSIHCLKSRGALDGVVPDFFPQMNADRRR